MNLGVRLQEVRKEKGLTQKQVADLIGCDQSVIGNIERRGSEKSKYAEALAIALNLNLRWFLSGDGEKYIGGDSSKVATASNIMRKIPVLNYVQAGIWRDVLDNPFEGEYVSVPEITAERPFALEVAGYSMIKDFFPGDIVVMDPDISPVSGDFVVAKNGDEACTFKKYRNRGIDPATGNEWFELIPSNIDEFQIIDSRIEPFEIVAVATDKVSKLRRGLN